MKTKQKLTMILMVAGSALFAQVSSAQILLALDAGASGQDVEPGFVAHNTVNGTYGAYSVTSSANFLDNTRGGGTDLTKDVQLHLGGTGTVFSLNISGFAPSTSYPISFWGGDSQGQGSVEWTSLSDTGPRGTITWGSGDNGVPASQYQIDFNATTNASGVLQLRGTALNNVSPAFNGIQVGTAVPEPSGAALLALGAAGIVLRRRRR